MIERDLIELGDYRPEEIPALTEIWNEVLEDGDAFPGEVPYTQAGMADFLRAQNCAVVACVGGEAVGFYILHPNNIGRCSHVANASYAIRRGIRGQGLGEKLVRDSLARTAQEGFSGLQFNAVVCTNTRAIQLYERLGFEKIGVIPHGFRLKDGSFVDIIIYYHKV